MATNNFVNLSKLLHFLFIIHTTFGYKYVKICVLWILGFYICEKPYITRLSVLLFRKL